MEETGSLSLQRIAPEQAAEKSDAARHEKDKRLKKVCADFESLFLYYMLKKMRSTIPKSGLMKEMQGKDTYETITDQKVSEKLADQGGVGLQKMLFNQMKSGI
jgi:flagellar protein FlgJ